MSRVVFALTEAQYLALCQAAEGRPSMKRMWSTAKRLQRAGFLSCDYSRGDRYFTLTRAGAAVVELGQALHAFHGTTPTTTDHATEEGTDDVPA